MRRAASSTVCTRAEAMPLPRCSGGTNTLAMVDDTTRSELQHMAIDVLFFSCDGLSFQHGLTTPYREEHTLKRAMMARANRVVALVDQSKFGNVQMFSFASFDEIDVLVTDSRVDPEAVDFLESHDISVLVA